MDNLFTWNSFSPRIGFNLKLTGDNRTVLRAHYGRYYRGIVTGEFDNTTPAISPRFIFAGTYDAEGNLLTGSLVDYPRPPATDVPLCELHRTVTPSNVNPLGVKGVGEAGTIGSAQTIVNAAVDALYDLGVRHIDMPLRSRRVWQAIQEASNGVRS